MRETTTAAIEAVGLSKRYGDVQALRGVDLQVKRGAITLLLGRNGAGKTTLLELLIGLRNPSAGTVRVLGSDPSADDATWRKRVGYLPQEVVPIDYLNAVEYIHLMAELYGLPREEVDRLLPEALEFFELTGAAGKRLGSYSTGMKKKVVLSALRVCRPEILLLDEPFEGLDPHAIRELQEWLSREAARGTTILLSSHIIALVAGLAEQLVIIDEGSIRYAGESPERSPVLHQGVEHSAVEPLFFALTERSENEHQHQPG